MKYKIIIACIFSTLVMCSFFGNAAGLNLNSTKNNFYVNQNINEGYNPEEIISSDFPMNNPDDAYIHITDPEKGYMYTQFLWNEPPEKGDEPGEILEVLNTAFYLSFVPQLYVDTIAENIPDGSKAKFTMKNFLGTEEYLKWDNYSSDGFSVFFNLSNLDQDEKIVNIRLFVDIRVKVYDSDGDFLTSDLLSNSVFYMYLRIPE